MVSVETAVPAEKHVKTDCANVHQDSFLPQMEHAALSVSCVVVCVVVQVHRVLEVFVAPLDRSTLLVLVVLRAKSATTEQPVVLEAKIVRQVEVLLSAVQVVKPM